MQRTCHQTPSPGGRTSGKIAAEAAHRSLLLAPRSAVKRSESKTIGERFARSSAMPIGVN